MKVRKNSKYFFRIISIIIFSVIVSFLVTSSILARYLSDGSQSDQARVAKWDIDFNDGTSFNSIISSTHLESGSTGEWGLEIENNSEVLAKFEEDSNLKIRLQSPDFHVDHAHTTWDFLVDNEHNPIDNPINFKGYMYNCSLAELEAANGDYSNIEVVEIFDTKNNPQALEFQMVINEGEVVKIIPEIGVVQEIIANPFVQIACFAIAIILFELSFKLDSKEKPKENEELKKEIELLKEELQHKE